MKRKKMLAKGWSVSGGKKLFILTILVVSLVLTGCVKKNVEPVSDEASNIQPVNQEQTENDADNDEVAADDDEVTVEKGNDKIKVFNIEDNQTVFSPLTIIGEGVAFENNLIIELRNSEHATMVKEFTTIKSSEVGEIGDYSITLNFEFSNTKEGFIAVYEQSPKDGSELNLVEIPVKFGNLDISNWQTYQNEEYGFELKYPNNWYWEDYTNEYFKIGFYPNNKKEGWEYNGDIEITAHKNENESLEEFYKTTRQKELILSDKVKKIKTRNGLDVIVEYDLPGMIENDVATLICNDYFIIFDSPYGVAREEMSLIIDNFACY